MANTFYLYFFGLICHIGEDTLRKQYAAIVRDEHHTPRAFLYENGEVRDFMIERNADRVGFMLDGQLSKGDASTTDSFRRFVPPLQTIMGGRIHSNIKATAILIDYPSSDDGPGPLAVPKLYQPNQGEYWRSSERRWGPTCVAKATELTIMTAARSLQIVSIKNDVRTPIGNPIAPRNCAIVANFPHHSSPGHLRKYAKILEEANDQVEVRQPVRCSDHPGGQAHCQWVREWLEFGVAPDDLECGNTNWP